MTFTMFVQFKPNVSSFSLRPLQRLQRSYNDRGCVLPSPALSSFSGSINHYSDYSNRNQNNDQLRNSAVPLYPFQAQQIPYPARLPFPWNQPTRREFHISAVVSFPIRRRRKGKTTLTSAPEHGDDVVIENESFTRVTDFARFEEESTRLLEKLYEAILPGKAKNDTFIVNLGHDTAVGPNLNVDLGPIIGSHNLQVDYQELMITYNSPMGQYCYQLFEGEGSKAGQKHLSWRNIADGHNLEGMVVRELLKTANGCPNL